MKDYLKILVVLLTVISFTACSDDDEVLDTEKPTIVMSEPTTGEEFEIGSELHIEINLGDNQGLASYKVEIHSNFDDHTHSVAKQEEETPWTYDETFQITGNPLTYNVEEHIAIPEGIAEGEYHVGIIVVDAAGNQAEAFADIMVGHHGDDHEEHEHVAVVE